MAEGSPALIGLDPEAHGLSAALSADVRLIDHQLGRLLEEQGCRETIEAMRAIYREPTDTTPDGLLERIPALSSPQTIRRVLRAYTLLFQLLNMAEQREIVRINRLRQAESGRGARPESIADAVHQLAGQGLSAAQMQSLISRIEVIPTLTAHPTEARRRAVLDKLHHLAYLLTTRRLPQESQDLESPLDAVDAIEQDLQQTLRQLWYTDELRATKLTVSDEVRNGLYFFDRTILQAVPWLHADLRRALADNYPGHHFDIPAFVRYRSWIGGDRDGNPNVTPGLTWDTLIQHRITVLRSYQESVEQLRRELTHSLRLVDASGDLMKSLEADATNTRVPQARLDRFHLEPFALKLLYMHERLQGSLDEAEAIRQTGYKLAVVSERGFGYAGPEEFLADLELVQKSLIEVEEGAGVEGPLANLIARVRTFGFQLAALDVRQHSDEHEKAIGRLLSFAGVVASPEAYSGLPESERSRLLARELLNPRPLSTTLWRESTEASHVRDVFDVIASAHRALGKASIECYIISMTHAVSDVLEPMLLAKEAGLVRVSHEADGIHFESDLDFVPLFETIDDLERGDHLLRELLKNGAYRLQVTARGKRQEVMLGYSDSSKDGGYFAANWWLYDAQRRLAATCKQAGIDLRLFHGRGGTVGRGGGRAGRAILSQPAGSFAGSIRFTEQGEVISFRYGLAPIAHRHLEQIVYASLLAASRQTRTRRTPKWAQAMQSLADTSQETYRQLVHGDRDFWPFYTQATPVQHISRLPMASRPVYRPGKALASLDGLRAIPWNFAWVQSRYGLPGWYGLGSALEAYCTEDEANLETLRDMYKGWPIFKTVLDNARLELVRARLDTAQWYATRVDPASAGKRIHKMIETEFTQLKKWIEQITNRELGGTGRSVVERTVDMRNPAVAPLSKLQVATMNAWDAEVRAGGDPEQTLGDAILLSIAGIAAAMQSTG